MATRNYHHARKQKEQARKARKEDKMQRRAARQGPPVEGETTAAPDGEPTAGDVTPGAGS